MTGRATTRAVRARMADTGENYTRALRAIRAPRPAQAPPPPDCPCGYDGEQTACVEGTVYGPCPHPNCGGVCEYVGDCDHDCHTNQEQP